MARKVKCTITKEYGTSDTFYKAPDGKYYKSKELYEFDRKQKEDRKEVIDIFCFEFLGYKPGAVFPTILTKKLQEFEIYGYDVIKATIEKCRSSIEYALDHKEFNSDMHKISYIMAILKNNINDVNREILASERENKREYIIDETVDIDDIQTTHKEKNISKWLEDDDD